MGYTTRFKGSFLFDKLPPGVVMQQIAALDDADGRKGDESQPDSYCQWQLTKDFSGIQWNGGEKFRNYVEWAQWILDKILTPVGIALYGQIEYFGEDSSDIGKLVIECGKVVAKVVSLTDELRRLLGHKARKTKGTP